jgi:hypothetical protein
MAEKRNQRDTESREATKRSSDAWVQPSHLPVPKPRDGWLHRWVRVSTIGKADMRNLSRRLREGWEPVNAAEYKELEIASDVDSRYPDGIEIGGLLLCRIPEEIVKKRNDHYDQVNKQQMHSVNEGFMNEHDPRMPKYNDSKSRTQFRKG